MSIEVIVCTSNPFLFVADLDDIEWINHCLFFIHGKVSGLVPVVSYWESNSSVHLNIGHMLQLSLGYGLEEGKGLGKGEGKREVRRGGREGGTKRLR